MSTECSLNEIAEYYACEIKKMSKGECSPYLRQKDDTMEVCMPDIESIDGMKIHRVHLRFVKARDVYLEIYSDSVRTGFVCDNEVDVVCYFDDEASKRLYKKKLSPVMTAKTLTKTVLKKYLRTAMEVLPTLKFDKYNGQFTTDEKKMRFNETWCSLLQDQDGICTKSDECCVCRENTLTKTHCCSNKLCYGCWDKIKEREDEKDRDSGYYVLPCPMCRHDLRWL